MKRFTTVLLLLAAFGAAWSIGDYLRAIAPLIRDATAQTGNTTGLVVTDCGAVPSPFVAGRPGPFTVDLNGISCDGSGPSAASGAGVTPSVSASAVGSRVIKAAAGNLYSAYALNGTGTPGFLLVLNNASVTPDGSVTPLACAPLPISPGVASISYSPPAVFSTGITVVLSSGANCFTKTTGVITGYISGSAK